MESNRSGTAHPIIASSGRQSARSIVGDDGGHFRGFGAASGDKTFGVRPAPPSRPCGHAQVVGPTESETA